MAPRLVELILTMFVIISTSVFERSTSHLCSHYARIVEQGTFGTIIWEARSELHHTHECIRLYYLTSEIFQKFALYV